jgi:hypothetical protein
MAYSDSSQSLERTEKVGTNIINGILIIGETMSPKETMRDLQKSLESKRAENVRLVMECENIIAQLRPICDHSKDEPYEWEHDNGYGTQTWVTGKRCSHCGFIDYWSRGRFIDPASTRE